MQLKSSQEYIQEERSAADLTLLLAVPYLRPIVAVVGISGYMWRFFVDVCSRDRGERCKVHRKSCSISTSLGLIF